MKPLEFDAPGGLMLPEGMQAGDRAEFMAEFELKPSGQLCLVGVDGNPLPGYEKPRQESMMTKYREEMGGA